MAETEIVESKRAVMGRPLLFENGEVLDSAITAAVEKLREEKRPIIVENIAIELDCSASTLRQYGMRVDSRPDFLKPIKRMLDVCQAYQVSALFGHGQVAGAIFALKNNFPDEYRDKIEYDVDNTSSDGSMSPKEPVDKSVVDSLIAGLKDQTRA